MNILIFNLIINSILIGIILTTQIVNYPLFKFVHKDFSAFHKKYVKLIGLIVAPIMIIEALIILAMLFQDLNSLLIQLSAVLVIIIWTSTFLIQVPIHNQLSLSKKKNLNLLIYSNWIRTICWILKLIISIMIVN